MARYGLLIDLKTCVGCKACMTACKGNHNIPYGEYEGREYYRLWPEETEQGNYPYVIRTLIPRLCMQCADPPCLKACPIPGALYQRPDGIVTVDSSRCDGCRQCLKACPYGALYFRQDKGIVDKCDLCVENIDEGLIPECAKVCPTGAIVFGDLEDPSSPFSQAVKRGEATPSHPEFGTRPGVYYTSGTSRLKGRVTSLPDNQPIAGASVTLTTPQEAPLTLITDKHGVFFAWNLPQNSTCQIKVSATGFKPFTHEMKLESEYHDLGNQELKR